ncbi:hypothetical protein ACJ41O_001782 [Fusarium nematophilum]
MCHLTITYLHRVECTCAFTMHVAYCESVRNSPLNNHPKHLVESETHFKDGSFMFHQLPGCEGITRVQGEPRTNTARRVLLYFPSLRI